MSPNAFRHLDDWTWPAHIITLGRFALKVGGREVETGADGEALTRELSLTLAKALMAFGGRGVAREELEAALWPVANGLPGEWAFDIGLEGLRKLLGSDDAVVFMVDGLSLNERYCWTDLTALDRLEQSLALCDRIGDHALVPAIARRALALAGGAFLPDDRNSLWATLPRKNIGRRAARLLRALADSLTRRGADIGIAVECRLRAANIEVDSADFS